PNPQEGPVCIARRRGLTHTPMEEAMSSNEEYTAEMLPMVWPDAANVRLTDPAESHIAADRAVGRVPTKLAVERALETAGHPVTSDEVWRIARQELGYMCTPQRVRTVLAEEAAFVAVEGGLSEFGNPARL